MKIILTNKVILIVLAICILTNACDKPRKDTSWTYQYPEFSLPADVPGTEFRLDSFPLAIGHSWTYKVIEQKVLAMDSFMAPQAHPSAVFYDSFNCIVTVVGDTFVNMDTARPAMRFIKVHSSVVVNEVWDGFSFHAPDALTSIFGGPSGDYYYAVTDSGVYSVRQFCTPDIYNWAVIGVYDQATLDLKLPAVVDRPWFPNQYSVADLRKSWVGYASVSTPFGVFNCVKLYGEINYLQEYCVLTTDQYYDNKGLVQQMQVKKTYYNGRNPNLYPGNRYSRKFILTSRNF